jgi:hypothetical protein
MRTLRKLFMPISAAVLLLVGALPASAGPIDVAKSNILQENCEKINIEEPDGQAYGQACWNGRVSWGVVHNSPGGARCAWVEYTWSMEDGSVKKWRSEKACGDDSVKCYRKKSPEHSTGVGVLFAID